MPGQDARVRDVSAPKVCRFVHRRAAADLSAFLPAL